MKPREVLPEVDLFLVERGLELEAVVIGGAALALLGVVDRPTRDCDVLHPELPLAVTEAAICFAQAQRKVGQELADNWLNNGPASLARTLNPGWESRLQPLFRGRAIRLSALGRMDLLALCDRLTDFDDCVALRPTAEELSALQPWVERQDANPDWPRHVHKVLDTLRRSLGHGI